MNEHFVCVKVDREERPDVDAIYMDARAGDDGPRRLAAERLPAPRTACRSTPAPTSRPSRARACRRWRAGARGVVAGVAASSATRSAPAPQQILPRLAGRRGARGRRRRAPTTARSTRRSPTLRRSLRRRARRLRRRAEVPAAVDDRVPAAPRRARDGAAHAARDGHGGIYDQVGGGFSRYSVDARWIVPHFEKMLYDNALLARAYLHALAGHRARRCSRAWRRETLDWALRELRQAGGRLRLRAGRRLRGRRGAASTCGRPTRSATCCPSDLAPTRRSRTSAIDRRRQLRGHEHPRARDARPAERLAEIKAGLLAAREQRVRPGLDDKRLTAWNALMIAALAEAGAVLERADYLDAAVARRRRSCAQRMRDADGRAAAHLQPRAGQARRPTSRTTPTCSRRSLTLYEATFDDALVRAGARARRRDHRALRRPRARRLLRRRRTTTSADRAAQGPRGHADPVGRVGRRLGLLRLAALTGEARYEQAAAGTIALLHALAPQHPTAFGHLLQAIDFHLAPVRRSRSSAPTPDELERVVRSRVPPAPRARGRRRRPCRCSRAATPSTAARPPTSASASPAGVP